MIPMTLGGHDMNDMFLISFGSSFQYFGATTLKALLPIETGFDLFSCSMYDFLANLVVR